MNGSKSRLTLTNLTEPQQIRELNRQLTWIWDQLLGGLSMKSLNEDARGYIDGIEIAVDGKLDADDNATGLDTGETGVQVRITPDEFSVNVPGELGDFRLGPEGGELGVLRGRSVTAADVAARYAGQATLTVNPEATGDQVAAGTHYRSLKDALSTLNGRVLDTDVTIYLAAGMSEYGDLSIRGLSGMGSLRLIGDSAFPMTLQGQLRIIQSTVRVSLQHIQVVAGSVSAIRAVANACLELFYCVVKAGADGQNALEVVDMGHVLAEGTTFSASGGGHGAYLTRGSVGVFVNSGGTGALTAYRSFMNVSGTVPDGGVKFMESPVQVNYMGNYVADNLPSGSGWTGDSVGSSWTGSGTVDSGSDAPSVEVIVTRYYSVNHTDNYCGNVWGYGEAGDVMQGWMKDDGRIQGCMWFDNSALRADLTSKTIKQAALSLYMREKVGLSMPVDVRLYGVSMKWADRNGFPVNTTVYGMIGRAEPGQINEITIPVAAINDLVSGRINGLMVHSSDFSYCLGSNYSRNYARFVGENGETEAVKPRLKVIYQ